MITRLTSPPDHDVFGRPRWAKTAAKARCGSTPDQVSPYEYWQYWRNTEDADVARFLKLFTVLPLEEIDRLAALKGAEINEAKKILATRPPRWCTAKPPRRRRRRARAPPSNKAGLGASLPDRRSAARRAQAGIGVLAAFVKAGLAASNGEVRRAIANNAIMVNDTRITDDKPQSAKAMSPPRAR